MKLGHTKWVKATANTGDVSPHVTRCGMIVPNENVLATNHCDFQEGLWNGDTEISVSVTNWGDVPIFIRRDSLIAQIEQVDVVSREDPHWKTGLSNSQSTVQLCQLGNNDRTVLLRERLRIGVDQCFITAE